MLLIASSLLLAQTPTPLFEARGRAADDGFGISVAGGGDVDGDGTPDLVVGAVDLARMHPLLALSDDKSPEPGYVHVLSGRDGRLLLELETSSTKRTFGLGVALIPDVDGDGRAAIAVAAPNAPSTVLDPFGWILRGAIVVHSGADGEVLEELEDPVAGTLGTTIAPCGDLDGDGRADLAVGHSGAALGIALVYSTRDWRVLLRVDSEADGFGRAIGPASDVDGDGTPDLIVGAPSSDHGDLPDRGSAFVLSGNDGAILHAWHGPRKHTSFGSAVAGIGDVDGDGRPDLLIGAKGLDRSGEHAGGAFVHSGATGELLYVLDGPRASAEYGIEVCALGDVNGDGRGDFAVSAHRESTSPPVPGRTRIHSGADGALLIDYPGTSVALAGDLDGDGKPEIVTGAWWGEGRGVVRAWSPARDLAR